MASLGPDVLAKAASVRQLRQRARCGARANGRKSSSRRLDVVCATSILFWGAERRVVFDSSMWCKALQNSRKLSFAINPRNCGCFRFPNQGQDALTDEGVRSIIATSQPNLTGFSAIVPAGIERGATLAMRYADEAVIVTNPEVSSVRDSDAFIGMLDSKTVRPRGRTGREACANNRLTRARGTGRNAQHRGYP